MRELTPEEMKQISGGNMSLGGGSPSPGIAIIDRIIGDLERLVGGGPAPILIVGITRDPSH